MTHPTYNIGDVVEVEKLDGTLVQTTITDRRPNIIHGEWRYRTDRYVGITEANIMRLIKRKEYENKHH